MPGPSELSQSYPPTPYVDQVADHLDGPAVGLIRTVCVAERLGQGDTELTDRLARLSAREVEYWLEEERADYALVREDVARFFRLGGAAELAEASVADITQTGVNHTRDNRAAFIGRTWQICRQNLPSEERLRSQPPAYKKIIAQNNKELEGETAAEIVKGILDLPGNLQSIWNAAGYEKNQAGTAGQLMGVDRALVSRGRLPGAFATEPHESVARALILERRPTGSGIFNLLGLRLQETVATGIVKHEMKALEAAWEQHHEGVAFLPTQYLDMLATIPREVQAARRIISFIARFHPDIEPIWL